MNQEIEKYERPFPLPALPPGVVRSPHRRPRWLGADRRWVTKNLKVAFLRAYTACHNIEESCAFVGRDIRTFKNWIHDDPDFKAAYLLKKAQWRAILGERLEHLDGLASEAIRDALTQTEDPRMRTEAAFRVLRSHGQLIEKTSVEHTGPDGGPVRIIHAVELIEPEEE